jgi:hypothetical protein
MDISKLLDELGATGEDRTAVESFFTKNPTAAQKASDWRENGLRQSDYDRKMNLGKAELDASQARVAQAEAAILASRDTMNGQYTKALEEREAAENALAATRARINRVATEYNIPATEFGLDGTQQTQQTQQTQRTQQTQPDPRYVSRQDFDTVVDLTKRLPMLPVQLMKLQREHQELFGTYFDEQTVIDKALELKKPLEQVADLMFGMTAKRNEKHDNQVRLEERAKVETEMKAKYSQANVNPMRTDVNAKPGPVFELKRPEIAGVPGPRPDRLQSGVEAAVNAFRESKYRPQEKSA